MSISRLRAVILGLLALLLVGSVMAATASAEAGPFWRHRAIGTEGEGERIEPKAPENFKGEGGEQVFLSSTTSEGKKIPVEIVAKGVQVKGAIFNGPHQGQIKLELIYHQLELKKPELKPCVPIVGSSDIVVVKGHLAWKWNGTLAQLIEQPQLNQVPDLIFTNVEPQQQEGQVLDFRKVGIFTSFVFKGSACGAFSVGSFLVSGSAVGITNKSLNEFGRKLAVRTLANGTFPEKVGKEEKFTGEGFLQHFWDGTAFQGVVLGLGFAEVSASLIGQTEVESAQQEVAVFEK